MCTRISPFCLPLSSFPEITSGSASRVSIAFVPRSYRLRGTCWCVTRSAFLGARARAPPPALSRESPERRVKYPALPVSRISPGRRDGYCESRRRRYFTRDRPFISRRIGSHFTDTRYSAHRHASQSAIGPRFLFNPRVPHHDCRASCFDDYAVCFLISKIQRLAGKCIFRDPRRGSLELS